MKNEYERQCTAVLIISVLIIVLTGLAVKFNSSILYFLSGFLFSTLVEEAMHSKKKLQREIEKAMQK